MPSLLQLRYFCELAKQGNVTQVAEFNHVSQTALSNAISRLEDELEVQLFDRIGRGIVLNRYGETYLSNVDKALGMLEKAKADLECMKNADRKVVTLSVVSSVLWAQVIKDFLLRHPDLSISQSEFFWEEGSDNSPPPSELIIAGSEDIASPRFCKVVFRNDRLWICVPPDHRLAQKKSVSLYELKDERFINLPRNTGFSRFCENLFEKIGFTPQIVAECDYALRRELLKMGMGIILYTDAAKRINYFNEGVSIPINDAQTCRQLAIFWRSDHTLSLAAQTFRDFVIKYYTTQNSYKRCMKRQKIFTKLDNKAFYCVYPYNF